MGPRPHLQQSFIPQSGETTRQLSLSPRTSNHFDPDDLKLSPCQLEDDAFPTFGNVSVSNSSDVHIGSKTYYQGAVTIEKVIYAGAEPNALPDKGQPDVKVVGATSTSNQKPVSLFNNINERFIKHYKTIVIIMATIVFLVISIVTAFNVFLYGFVPSGSVDVGDDYLTQTDELEYCLVSRHEWVAQPASRPARPLPHPSAFVVVSETGTEGCNSLGDCVFVVRFLQTYFIEGRNLSDIPYNFLIGGDGSVYEGRGWHVQGEHTFQMNSKSLGIAFIGSFQQVAPSGGQTEAFQKLIKHETHDLPANMVKIVSRREWNAEAARQPPNELTTPVPYVIIWHTATENCSSQATCTFMVRQIQKFHMESRKWWDVAYNFLIGGDGYVYEGRGWTQEGSHTLYYNKKSIGIALVGTFTNYLPPRRQLDAVFNLIRIGVNESFIQPDYKLFAARDLSSTESPGQMLYHVIQHWPHYSNTT